MAQQAKCLTRKIITLGKRATGRSSSYEESKKEYKDKKGETDAAVWRCPVKKVFLEILQNSLVNTYASLVVTNLLAVCQSLVLMNLLPMCYFHRNFIIDFCQGPECANTCFHFVYALKIELYHYLLLYVKS